MDAEMTDWVLKNLVCCAIMFPVWLFVIRPMRKQWDGERHWFFAPFKKKRRDE